MDKSKKVSVIMATYNCAETVAQSIESVLDQTYDNIEFIICDDGSSDATFEILKTYKSKFPDKIVLIKNKENMKLPYTLNHCLKYVTGDYVARMDADDLSKPNRFEVQVRFLQEHLEYDLVSTGIEITNGNEIVGKIIKPEFPNYMTMTQNNAFSHATILTYPYVYEKLGGYSLDKYAERVEDKELWFRFFEYGFKGYGIQNVLYTVLEDENTYSRRKYKYRINSTVTTLRGYKRLSIPKKYWVKAFIPLINGLVPNFIYKKIHLRKHAK